MDDMAGTNVSAVGKPATQKYGKSETGPGTKRSRTRVEILNAAFRIFARDGIAASSILEVTREAGLSNGAFYFYFKNKEELVHSVGEMLIVHVLDDLHSFIDDIDDPSEKIAIGIQWVIDRSAEDPELGSLLAESMETDGPYSLELHARFRVDARAGIALGQFEVENLDLVCDMIAAIDAAAIRAVIGGADLDQVDRVTAEQHLRMLGVERATARELVVAAQARLRSLPSA
jgi:AcrR family transcriptional regulator